MAGPNVRTRRWTRVEYDRLIEAGFFRPGDPVELVGGQMIVAEPRGSRGGAGDLSRLPGRSPVQPVARGRGQETSLTLDRIHKGSLYARAGLPDYWIVDLPKRRREVYRDPEPDATAPFGWRYRSVTVLELGASVSPLARPDRRLQQISALFL